MSRLTHLAIGAAALGAFVFACAQEAPVAASGPASSAARKTPAVTAEAMQKSMETAMGSMVPMMVKMTEATMEAQLSAAEKPETASRIAAFKRNLYVSLQKQGFKPSEAMQIVVSTPLPSASFSGK